MLDVILEFAKDIHYAAKRRALEVNWRRKQWNVWIGTSKLVQVKPN